jgi:hypothetical protein
MAIVHTNRLSEAYSVGKTINAFIKRVGCRDDYISFNHQDCFEELITLACRLSEPSVEKRMSLEDADMLFQGMLEPVAIDKLNEETSYKL